MTKLKNFRKLEINVIIEDGLFRRCNPISHPYKLKGGTLFQSKEQEASATGNVWLGPTAQVSFTLLLDLDYSHTLYMYIKVW